MSATVQTPKLQASEVWALYGGELEYCLGGEGEDEEEEGEDFDQCGAEYQRLSNQDYYSQMEALKRMHLQNIEQLDVMYLNELTASKGKASQEAEMNEKYEIDSAQTNTTPRQDIKLQQNSVNKSDISVSRAWEVKKEKKKAMEEKEEKEEKEKKENKEEAAGQASRQSSAVRDEAKSSKPQTQPEQWAASKPVSAAAKHQPRAPSRRPSGAEPSSRIAKVTLPKPFKMMLREDDKKRRNLKTRSEMELENTLLRKELTELRECQRQFRATPAPPRTRLPLSEVIGQRATGGRSRTTSLDRAARAEPGSCWRAGGSRDISPEPFSFIERERRKREMRLESVLSSPTSREERWVFKARPLPRLYRAASEDHHLFGAPDKHSRGEEQHRRPDVSRELHKHAGRLEDERGSVEVEKEADEKSEDVEHGAESTDGSETPILCSNWRLRRKPSLAGKGLLVEGETRGVRRGRERDWSYIHPIRRTSISLNLASSFSQEPLPAGKSDYISV